MKKYKVLFFEKALDKKPVFTKEYEAETFRELSRVVCKYCIENGLYWHLAKNTK